MIKINIPETDQERVVVIGAGFGGLNLARKLAKRNFQVVLIDRHNYHQFQPLFYQVAMSGLEPSSIVFPLRKIFRKFDNVFVRITKVISVDSEQKQINTSLGIVNYDKLVIAIGADTNFFGNEHIAKLAIPMKSVGEALFLRNAILTDYERALSTTDYDARQELIDIVIVGGGATGVEVAGSLAEMKKYILPKEYRELNYEEVDIYLVQSGDRLLNGMSEKSSAAALEFLQKLGVKVMLGCRVTDFDGEYVYMKDGTKLQSRKLVWAAGIKANAIEGMPESSITYGSRIKVNRFNEVADMQDVYAIGDVAYMEEPEFPKGHPQVAQTAIQMGKHLANNLVAIQKGKAPKEFHYNDKGSMATIGRAKAVVDLPKFHFHGFFAWIVWLVVHLFSLVGVKNKLFVFINWLTNYLFYDQSLRLIIKASGPEELEKKDFDNPTGKASK